jgi:RNA polymerase sigma factor (sigma-70 family)
MLLRLQRDERLVAAIRDDNERAFEVLFNRYRPRLLAFCRGMVGSAEDAEDVLQETFTAAHAAIVADRRELAVRPWLYRIARNRCLNHMRRPRPESSDLVDTQPHENGASTADRAERREELRSLLESIQDLPESQRGALLLREVEAFSYEDIARTMGTTVPAVKSLLVRARMGLAEASRARDLTCDEVRLELAEAAEGLRRTRGEVRQHVRHCANCEQYRAHLRSTSRGLEALAPVGLVAIVGKLFGSKLGGSGAAASGGAGSGAAASGGIAVSGAATSGGFAGSALTTTLGTVAGGIGVTGSKIVATAAVATLIGTGAGEVALREASHPSPPPISGTSLPGLHGGSLVAAAAQAVSTRPVQVSVAAPASPTGPAAAVPASAPAPVPEAPAVAPAPVDAPASDAAPGPTDAAPSADPAAPAEGDGQASGDGAMQTGGDQTLPRGDPYSTDPIDDSQPNPGTEDTPVDDGTLQAAPADPATPADTMEAPADPPADTSAPVEDSVPAATVDPNAPITSPPSRPQTAPATPQGPYAPRH